MTSMIMTRSFADHAGLVWPPDVAEMVGDNDGTRRFVTWREIHNQRRERQADRLACLRGPAEPAVLPCYVWTFPNDWIFPYGGWFCYVVTLHFTIAVNFKGFDDDLATSIMTALPLGLFLTENFDRWMEEFTRQHPRKKHPHDPREAGSVVGWLEDRLRFTLEKP